MIKWGQRRQRLRVDHLAASIKSRGSGFRVRAGCQTVTPEIEIHPIGTHRADAGGSVPVDKGELPRSEKPMRASSPTTGINGKKPSQYVASINRKACRDKFLRQAL